MLSLLSAQSEARSPPLRSFFPARAPSRSLAAAFRSALGGASRADHAAGDDGVRAPRQDGAALAVLQGART
eukprot:263969-Rhodomonas_salina.1